MRTRAARHSSKNDRRCLPDADAMTTTDFVMPKLGLTMTEGTVARWDVVPGSHFEAGDIIVVVETDKIAYDVEAPAPGILHEVLVSEGNAVPVGTPIGRWDVGEVGICLDAPAAAERVAEEAAAPPPIGPEEVRIAATMRSAGDGERILATPYARRLAREASIDVRSIDGTGPRGRIKAADVDRAIAARGSRAAPPALRSTSRGFSRSMRTSIAACRPCTPNSCITLFWPPRGHSISPPIHWSSAWRGAAMARRGRPVCSERTTAGPSAAWSPVSRVRPRLTHRRRVALFGSNARKRAFPCSRPIRLPDGRLQSASVRCEMNFALTPKAGRYVRLQPLLCSRAERGSSTRLRRRVCWAESARYSKAPSVCLLAEF